MDMPPTLKTKSGEVRIVDSSNFKVSTTAMALVTVHPGGLGELHWHPNADEWQFFISGKGRMTVVDTGNNARTMDFQEGDVGYVQKTLLHYVENTGDTDLMFLEMFGRSIVFTISPFPNGWLILRRKPLWRIRASTRPLTTRSPKTAAS
jgi:oxalate decarboxylase